MTSKDKHRKHPKLSRSIIGAYHRCEWSIYGTGCNGIQAFFDQILNQLETYNLLYVDADHNDMNKGSRSQIGNKQFSNIKLQSWNEFDDKLNTHQADAVFVNGNHFTASQQIVIIDTNKKESLRRRVNQLDNIRIVVVTESENEIFDFVLSKMTDQTVVFSKNKMDDIIACIANEIEKSTPLLKAVILAGGESKRMGFDKSQIQYQKGVSQEKHLFKLLSNRNINTYISKEYNHKSKDKSEQIITDRLIKMGPFGAIISAMMTDPNAAWLVIACDLPFLDGEIIDRLIKSRNPSKFATAFRGKDNPFPEPLITIYEPRSYRRFLSFMSLGYACPRKVLINSDIEEIVLNDLKPITNVNTPEEMNNAKSNLNHG